MKNLSYALGIDVSKDHLDCCISSKNDNLDINVIQQKKFKNSIKGFEQILAWTKKLIEIDSRLIIVAETTGVYYENMAHYFHENSDWQISILLPIKAKYYFKSLSVKSKTDKIDAKMLAQFGLERKLPIWEPLSENMLIIKQLSREYRDLKIELNKLKNRLHAKKHSYKPSRLVLKIIRSQIKLISKQCLELEHEIQNQIEDNEVLNEKVEKVCTIPGIQKFTAITIIAETNGFKLIKNGKQLCSYAGLDVIINESGNKKGKSKISKKGNKYIRQAIYMPALSASKHIETMKAFYKRINEKNKCKKVGLLAVSRKLLILIYTLWKKDEIFKIV